MSILVVGDSMLDKHTKGKVERISPEAPVPVVNAGSDSTYSLGAAANVAAQVAAYGIDCLFAYRAFEDDPDGSHDRLAQMCLDKKIRPRPLYYPDVSFPVTTKERIWAEDQQLCRVDREFTERPTGALADNWINQLTTLIDVAPITVVIFSDYDKGTLTDYIIQQVADYCLKENVLTILDPKRYSYWGLQNLTLIKPNAREVSITNMTPKQVSKELGSTWLLNTLGVGGMDLWSNGDFCTHEDSIAEPNEVIDVCGCGDTVNAMLGIALHESLDIYTAIQAASMAAAENTRHRGCYVLSKEQVAYICNQSEANDGRT
jgi:D-beta-D-heptose 7-phosphate kinase/D-beta-D-heptose 1-phosphate adenosyltransferase